MKKANLIVIGGPISSGKSTLANSLPFKSLNEIDLNDKILKILLESTYSKKRVTPEIIEFYFFKKRESKYQKYATKKVLHILDRSIFESLWFVKKNLAQKSFKYFNNLFNTTIKNLINKYGKPKLYILLNINWETFCKRLFARNHKEEMLHFEKNKKFFKEHIRDYVAFTIKLLKKHNLNYVVIDTNNLSAKKVHTIALKIIKEYLNEK